MDKFKNQYKWILALMTAMAFMPRNNLFAGEWGITPYFWDYYTPSYIIEDENHFWKELTTEVGNKERLDDNDIGIEYECYVDVYANAEVWSEGQEYSNS